MSDAQKRIALEIVDDLEREFHDLTWMCCSWDSDKAVETIAMLIPQTAAEQEDEFQRTMADIADEDVGPPRPSRFAALRESVHATDGMSITCVIEAATNTIERLRQELAAARAEREEAVATQERLRKRCEQLQDDAAHATSANERLDAMLGRSKKRFFTANQLAIKRTRERDAALRNARDYKQMAEEERAECFRLIDQYGEHQDGCTSKDGDVDCECGFHAAYLRASTRLAACQSFPLVDGG